MSGTFRKLLVANRGEIACRVIRSAHAQGYRTVAVYSEADAAAPHVRLADEAVCIGPPEASASYLRVDAILDAARRTGADAVHPGYGFLSENAAFARACASAGLTFVGPPPDAIDAMGDKARAKARMIEAEVPCVPGYQGNDQSPERIAREAEAIGFPVLIKASAGGGGRGMRRVERPDDVAAALASAQTEAAGAFGSSEVLLEKLVEHARHVEVQVFGDAHGNAIHLGERDCSAQRRHQKVIEEAPSPAVDPELRARMGEAAVRAAQAIGYQGAGTVEFLLDDDGQFYFLEMNTRLQVEHPVTELITGLDLVALQLDVAAGRPLPLTQDEVVLHGHAIEVRLYAEDPAQGFLPQTGPVLAWRPPRPAPGVRCDHGIDVGQEISAYYDPMVAKIMAHGRDREQARLRLVRALEDTALLGLRHNKHFLLGLLDSGAFVDGEVRTRMLDEQLAADAPPAYLQLAPMPSEVLAVAAALWTTLHGFVAADAFHNAHTRDFPLPLRRLDDDAPHALRVTPVDDDGYLVSGSLGPDTGSFEHRVVLHDGEGVSLRVDVDGLQRDVTALHHDGELHLEIGGAQYRFAEDLPRGSDDETAGNGQVRAPSSGKVLSVDAGVGAAVSRGDALLRVEAMKIETVLAADVDGVVAEVRVATGDVVKAGAVLVVISPVEDDEADGTA